MTVELDKRSLKPAIWMILITAFLDQMALGMVFPVLPALVEEFSGSNQSAGLWTGLMGSLWALMQFFCAPVIGSLSDRFGRRPVILMSSAGLALDWVLMALAPNLWWLVVARAICGITSSSGTVIFAYMADISPPEGRARAFGLAGAAFSAGFIGGPALGGILGSVDPRLPFWVAAGLSGAAFFYGLFVLPESLAREKRTPFSWRRANPVGAFKLLRSHRELSGLATTYFLFNFAHQIFSAVFVLYAGHRYGMGPLEVGVLLTLAGTLNAFVLGVLVGPAAKRFGNPPTMIFGLVGSATGLLAMGLAPTGWLFAAALIPNALFGFATPTLMAIMSARVSEREQGQLQGAKHSVANVAGIFAPLFFGWVYGMSVLHLPGLSFVIAAAVLLIAAICGAIVAFHTPVGSAVQAIE